MLDIDTAIKHCLDVAEQNETQAEKWHKEGGAEWGKTINCRECATDHRQLAEWLRELKEAKRLLKAAVEDFSEMKPYLSEPYSHLCDKWRYADEALKLLNDEKINNVE